MAVKRRTVGQRIIERLGGVTQAELADVRRRAYEAGFNDGGEDEPVSGDIRRYGYRRTGRGARRDFSKVDWQQVVEAAWSLWQSSPMAGRILEIKRDYIIGHGIAPQTGDTELQVVLDAFWDENRMGRRSREFSHQLYLFGVQCLPVFVRQSDGRVKLGYIDPAQIERVIAHPENALEMWAVVVKETQDIDAWIPRAAGTKGVYRIIRKSRVQDGDGAEYWLTHDQAILQDWELVMLKAFSREQYDGSCFYEKVNSVSNQTTGYSDLLPLADWMDQHDETLWALGEREQMAGFFSWDVTMTGANDNDIMKRRSELAKSPPSKGSVRVHNEAEQWRLDWPDLKQTASIEAANALLTFILGGAGLPRHWYGYGDETNRATAAAQGDPTWRSLEHDQDVVHDLFVGFLEFQRDQAWLAGAWQPEDPAQKPEDVACEIVMPEMTSKDLTAVASAASALILALTQARDNGWITNETAAQAWAKVMAELDIEIDPVEELKATGTTQMEDETGLEQDRNQWFLDMGLLQPVAAGE
jgi:hypothetical protein